jgi:hypothetical protein
MNRTIKAALLGAKRGALSDYVIECAGNKVTSVKKGLSSAAKRAGIVEHVHPHLLRHSAAVHMAEAGIPMEEIAQYLGHRDINVTRRIYARFSPDYLRQAATALEYDDLGSLNQRKQLESNLSPSNLGAGDGIRTHDPNLGKVRGAVSKMLMCIIFPFVSGPIAHALPKLTLILPLPESDARH